MYRPWSKSFPVALLALGWSLTVVPPARAADGDAVPNPAARPSTPDAPREKRTPPPEPPVIERLRARGVEVKSAGLIGRELRFWLVRSADGRDAFVATTAEGYLLRGKIYHPDGALALDTEGDPPLYLDEEGRRAHGLPLLTGAPPTAKTDLWWRIPHRQGGPKPPAGSSGTVWDQLGQATAIEEGKAGAPLVYIFIDPYCPYCHHQWSALREKVRQGKLRVRWVPVAVLSDSQSHLDVVQGLLRDPSAETLAGWMRERRVAPDDSEATQVALGRNLALFQALKASSVPALIYKDQTGQLITRVGLTDL